MTTAIGWFTYCLRHYAQFVGRASRPEYWWFQAVVWIVNLILHILSYRVLWAVGILTIIWNLGVVVPHLAVASRRLHDSGHSLWWIAPPIIGWSVIVGIKAFTPGNGPMPNTGSLLLVLLLVWLGIVAGFVYLLCKPGNEGGNRYGDPAPTVPS